MSKLLPQDVEKIRELRKGGMSYPALAKKFGLKNHTSIIYWCRKSGLPHQYSKRIGKPRIESIAVSGIERVKGGLYEIYLEKYLEKQNKDLPISEIFKKKLLKGRF